MKPNDNECNFSLSGHNHEAVWAKTVQVQVSESKEENFLSGNNL